MSRQTHVIVGASLAGASAAAELRKRGFDGGIVLIGDERHRPYERPELSKKYLRGELDVDVAVRDSGFYDEHGIELMLGAPVERIDLDRREVHVDERRIGFDRLLLATGSRPRRLPVPGADLDGVVTLRTIDDADTIRLRALDADSVVVVGGGWIGSEVAASLRQLGVSVTLVTATHTPLETVLGPEVGRIYGAAHEAHGVRLVTEAKATAIEGEDRATGVRLEDGSVIRGDLVVVGVGAEPRTELARAAGLAVEDGVLVDEYLESSAKGVFAAGDVARAVHPLYRRRVRVEHWDNAKRQGRAAAANMLGAAVPYDRIPYFYSDQYDIGMEYTGFAPSWDRVVFRGDPATNEFVAFWLLAGRVVAGMNVNTWDVAPAIEALIRSGATVNPEVLADTVRPLTELAAA
jgi:3-phenylpropionate/trans-cinnamate dioxygenase ferredoxin reductase subunit